MPGMDHAAMPAMDHAAIGHGTMSGMDQGTMPGMDHTAMPAMDHGTMRGHDQGEMSPVSHAAMDMGSMQGGSAPANARDPDYSDGISFTPDNDVHMHGDAKHSMLLLDRLEYFDGRDSHGVSLDAQGWYGGDTNKLWLKVEGEHSDGRIESLRTEALWSHAAATYWDTQLGVRHDAGVGPNRDWVAFGVQGLAPYWFDVQATAYVGPNGRTAARAEVEYEVLFTQRLILTPRIEVNLYGKDDPARGVGKGLSDAGFSLRLRYEIRRRFAPYIGISWSRRFGTTADFARRDGRSASDRQIVAGIRIWL